MNEFIPISIEHQNMLNNPNCNFSLYSPRMVVWEWKGDKLEIYKGEEKNKDKDDNKKKKKDESALGRLRDQSEKSYPQVKKFLDKKREVMKQYMESAERSGCKVFKFHVKSTSPFISGLGSGHPTETGMILDRNIGVPYIPASSIKGVMRFAHALNIANGRTEVPDSELEKYFGTTDEQKKEQKDKHRGQLMFFDAYPTTTPKLKMDIMNPHYGSYYQGGGKIQPVETETPVPIKFISVEEGLEFDFYCIFEPLQDEACNESEIKEMFRTAFEKVGFGGKTAIGYGRFKEVI